MKMFMFNLELSLDKNRTIVACCCGHGKYPMTIIIEGINGNHFDLVSGVSIPRKKRFYKRDKQGYYYIPEVI